MIRRPASPSACMLHPVASAFQRDCGDGNNVNRRPSSLSLPYPVNVRAIAGPCPRATYRPRAPSLRLAAGMPDSAAGKALSSPILKSKGRASLPPSGPPVTSNPHYHLCASNHRPRATCKPCAQGKLFPTVRGEPPFASASCHSRKHF